MKMRKVISAFLVLICIISTLGLCTIGASAAEGAKTVYATTNASAKQGSTGYLYVYLDDLTDLSALNVSVYYDTEKITVKSVTNRVSSVVNDLATGDGCVNASYIFDGKGTAAKSNLFYIYYQVNNTAEIGDTYFDIVVNEAYNSSLEGMDFTGSRCSLEITGKTVTKSCSITSNSTVSTSVGEEFELSYRLSTYQIASGSMNIHYDTELFEVVSVTNGGFLTDKIADINTALDGTIAISFVGTTYNYQYDVVKVRFKTLKNVTEASDIKLVVTDLYDKELNFYSCSGSTTKASIAFDETYTVDASSMTLQAAYNASTDEVTLTVKLDRDSMLGAGDFALKFDTNSLTYHSTEKGFTPTFFNINDKNVSNGILKFSIISLSDITDEQIVLTVTFDVKHACEDKLADFEISGNGLTDALTNTIVLNFVDANVTIPLKHTAATATTENRVEPTCTTNGSYDSVVYCSVCGEELSRETVTRPALGHTAAQAVEENRVEATCTADGHYDSVVYCSVCGEELSRETVTLPALGHTAAQAVEENRVEATCATDGHYDSVVYCSVCGEELSREKKTLTKLMHNLVHHEAKAPTCTEIGWEAYDACSRCDYSTYEELPMIKHDLVHHKAKAPTCTDIGWEAYDTCSRCDYSTYSEIPANGHTPATAVEENRIEATCTTDGHYNSVVYCSVCGEELSRENVTIPAFGHEYDYVNIVWSWSEDYSKATATVKCIHDKTHTKEISAVITSVTKEATETKNGEIVYTATVTVDGKTYKIEKRVTIPAQGQPNDPSNTLLGCLSTINSDGMMIGLTLIALTIAIMMRGKRKES